MKARKDDEKALDDAHERFVKRLYLNADGKAHFRQEQCCWCRKFVPLSGPLGSDWGVCINDQSPRDGLLTFEHDGCDKHIPIDDDE